MRSRSGYLYLPVLPIQNSSQRESQNQQGDYTPFPRVRAYAPDLSYVVYSYLPYRQPLHIVSPAYFGTPFIDVYAQGDDLVQWLRFKNHTWEALRRRESRSEDDIAKSQSTYHFTSSIV